MAPVISLADVSVDTHSVVRVLLCRAKTDPFGKGVELFLGKTWVSLCPSLNYMEVQPKEEGPLFIIRDGRPLSRDLLVK